MHFDKLEEMEASFRKIASCAVNEVGNKVSNEVSSLPRFCIKAGALADGASASLCNGKSDLRILSPRQLRR